MKTFNDDTETILGEELIAELEIRKMLASEMNDYEVDSESPVDEREYEDFVTDVENAVKVNYYYGSKLGWNQHYDKINDILLQFSGMKNVSLGPEAFAHALAAWQKSQGFSEADSDG